MDGTHPKVILLSPVGKFGTCVNDLAEQVVNDIGLNDLPQRRTCHFAVQYAAHIRGMDAWFILVDPMPWEPMASCSLTVFLTESRRPGIMDFKSPTLEDGEELHMWLL